MQSGFMTLARTITESSSLPCHIELKMEEMDLIQPATLPVPTSVGSNTVCLTLYGYERGLKTGQCTANDGHFES